MPKPLAEAFAGLAEPRLDRSKKHLLSDVVAVAPCAVIAGADSWEEVERFGEAKLDWLRKFLPLANGVPSHDTFYRLFARIDPRRPPGAWPTGWPGPARRPACGTWPWTTRRCGRRPRARSAAACTW